MSTVEGKKQEKRRALLDAAYELFLERGTAKTSVEDITSRAKVGKGTFYLYFADKGSVTQALLARVSYQLLDNACAAAEQHAAELTSFPDQMIFVIDHIIEALRADTLMLRFLERSFVWPGLDQIEGLRGRCLANPIRIHRKALRPFQRPKVLRVPLVLPCTNSSNPLGPP